MELTIGDKRNFSFSNKHYEIKEILEKPPIILNWTWNTGVCPHCKKRIERKVAHRFYRIEILIDIDKNIDNATLEDIVIMGDTFDGKRMIFPLDKYNEVFDISKKFKKFVGVK